MNHLACGFITLSNISRVLQSIRVSDFRSLQHIVHTILIVSMQLLSFSLQLLLSSLNFIKQIMKTKAAVSCMLVSHSGLFANLVVKRCLKPISSESSLQGCFMLYQIDIVHKMVSNVVCCIFRALCIFNEGFIP